MLYRVTTGPWEAVTNKLFAVSSNTATLERLVNQLGTSQDTQQLRHQLHNLLEETKNMVKKVSEEIKPILVTPTDEKLQQTKIQKDFEEILKRFHQVSRLSASRTREFMPKAKTIDDLIDSDEEQNDGQSVPLLTADKIKQLKSFENQIQFNEAIIEERDQELRHIEQSILEVNEIFRDLGSLVNDQQYMLDNIESNVGGVVVHLEGAATELSSANQYHKRARKRKMWLACIFISFVLLILLFIVV